MLSLHFASCKAAMGAALCLWLCTLGAIALASTHEQFSDPFAPYSDILPGLPDDRAFALPFVCQQGVAGDERFDEDREWFSCSTTRTEGPFADIRVIVFDEAVQMVEFTVRGNELTIGDLALSWVRPNMFVASNQEVTFYWDDRRVTATAKTDSGRFNYLLPLVRFVFLGGR